MHKPKSQYNSYKKSDNRQQPDKQALFIPTEGSNGQQNQYDDVNGAQYDYPNRALTLWEISLPSAFPANFLVATPITFPISLVPLAPTSFIICFRADSSSPSLSCLGRNSWMISSSALSTSAKSSLFCS